MKRPLECKMCGSKGTDAERGSIFYLIPVGNWSGVILVCAKCAEKERNEGRAI